MLLNKEILAGVYGNSNKKFEFNLNWNLGTAVVTAYQPGQPIGQNDFDRPRINTWRSDSTNIVYLSVGNQVYDPVSQTITTPWGNRSSGTQSINVLLNGSLSAGVDFFTSTLLPTPTLDPHISQWSVSATNPNELRYQYTISRANSAVQNISITI